jgi:hypothetical protein
MARSGNSAVPVSSPYCQLSDIICTFIFLLFLSEGREGESWEPSDTVMLFPCPHLQNIVSGFSIDFRALSSYNILVSSLVVLKAVFSNPLSARNYGIEK